MPTLGLALPRQTKRGNKRNFCGWGWITKAVPIFTGYLQPCCPKCWKMTLLWMTSSRLLEKMPGACFWMAWKIRTATPSECAFCSVAATGNGSSKLGIWQDLTWMWRNNRERSRLIQKEFATSALLGRLVCLGKVTMGYVSLDGFLLFWPKAHLAVNQVWTEFHSCQTSNRSSTPLTCFTPGI